MGVNMLTAKDFTIVALCLKRPILNRVLCDVVVIPCHDSVSLSFTTVVWSVPAGDAMLGRHIRQPVSRPATVG